MNEAPDASGDKELDKRFYSMAGGIQEIPPVQSVPATSELGAHFMAQPQE